jgi:hypothetical protein
MTEEYAMPSTSEPTTEELRAAFDDMVGNPRPSRDLAERARRRGTVLRRQRLSTVSVGVATVTLLTAPSVLTVRHELSTGGAVGGKPSATAPAKAAAPSQKPDTGREQGTQEQKQRALGVTAGASDPAAGGDSYVVTSSAPSARDQRRIAAAAQRLGAGFTKVGSGEVTDPSTGDVIGTSATYRSTPAGTTVGVLWMPVNGGAGAAGAKSGATSGSGSSQASQAKGDLRTGGAVAASTHEQVTVKFAQSSAGAPTLTTDALEAIASDLLAADS